MALKIASDLFAQRKVKTKQVYWTPTSPFKKFQKLCNIIYIKNYLLPLGDLVDAFGGPLKFGDPRHTPNVPMHTKAACHLAFVQHP